MDPNTALHVLRIDPFAPLTVAAIELAYAHEAAARHPSRYRDAAGRQAAEGWAVALAAARATLLEQAAVTQATSSASAGQVTDAASLPAPSWPTSSPRAAARNHLSPGDILGIVAGVLVLMVVIAGIDLGVKGITDRFAGSSSGTGGASEVSEASDLPDVDYVPFEETGFGFETAMEVYYDGRLGGCPARFERGCWEAALIPEASCGMISVIYAFSNDPAMVKQESRSTQRTNVVAGEPVELVFGNDAYDYGWVEYVGCIAPPTQAPQT